MLRSIPSCIRARNTRLTLTGKPDTAQVKNAITDPVTGSTYLDIAVATRSSINRSLEELRPAVGSKNARRLDLGQIEGVEICPAAQHRLVGILGDHRLRAAVDDLIDDRGGGLIDEGLVRNGIAWGLRIVAHERAGLRRGDALARRQFCRHRALDRGLHHGRLSRRPHRPYAEIRTHGSLLAFLESNPNPSPPATIACTPQRNVRERGQCRATTDAKI